MNAEHTEISSFDIIIVGAGFAGIGMAISLKRLGIENFIVLERAADVGGTWRDNTYPGAACDVPSHLYSFSFALNPNWSRTFSPQKEIWEYQKRVVAEFDIEEKFLFHQDLVAAEWNEHDATWNITTSSGQFSSRFFVAATGTLSDPKMPDIPGLAEFQGELMHSAAWRSGVPLSAQRIGVVGTGASAVQIVPELAKSAGELTVFQRSAPYVTPRHDREYTLAEKSLFARMPSVLRELREELFWSNEGRFVERQAIPALLEETSRVALGHLAQQVKDPKLRAKLTPDYQIGCKRILKSQDYYPALTRENVHLETTGITKVGHNYVELSDTRQIELDALVFATGFEAADLAVAHRIFGRMKTSLGEQWMDGMQAYATTAVHNFPNFFILKGPNAGLGHNSILYVIEAQIEYVTQAIDYAIRNELAAIEVNRLEEEQFSQDLQRRAQGTVWMEGGCNSWYVDPRNGRLTTLWPDFAHVFRDENATFDPQPYRVQRKVAA